MAPVLAEIHNAWGVYCEAVTENQKAPGWYLSKGPGAGLLKFISAFLCLTSPCFDKVNTSAFTCNAPDPSDGMLTDITESHFMHSCAALGEKEQQRLDVDHHSEVSRKSKKKKQNQQGEKWQHQKHLFHRVKPSVCFGLFLH